MGKARGCGTRANGAIYMEAGCSGGFGIPIGQFLLDPPIPLDCAALGITPMGVKLIEQNGVWHVFDWIGSEHYPNVADFVEEAMRMGISRRLSKSLEYNKLTPDSKMFLIHPKALAEPNVADAKALDPYCCPTEKHHAPNDPECCGRYWSQLDLETIDTAADPPVSVCGGGGLARWAGGPNCCVRKMPSFDYHGSIFEPEQYDFRPAVIMRLPIENLTVIKNPFDLEDQSKALNAAGASRLPVKLEDD